MRPIISFEPFPPTSIVKQIMAAGRFIIHGRLDYAAGAGKIDAQTKAIWTDEGRRIEVSLGAAFIISQSREVDPEWVERTKHREECHKDLGLK